MRLRLLAVALLLTVVACQAVGAPAGQQQYIVKTKHLIKQKDTKAAPSVQDVVRAGGGHVDYEWRDRLVVTLPDSALQALVQHPAVEFVQKVVSGIPESGTAAVESTDPVVASSAFRPAPKSFPPWTSGTYSYDGQGNITAIGSNAYSYDAFSRLATSTTNGIPETYTYDRYGNLTQKVTGTGSTALMVISDVDDANHLSGHCYDKAGNLTDDRDADPVHCPTATETYSFDALNRMTVKWNHTTHTKEYYIYNANDERIAVIPCSETACTEQITFSFRDESGKVLRQFEVPYQQFDSPWTWVEDYVYRDGVLLAAERVPAQGGRRYLHTDHLGTPRLITDSSGRRISEHDYFPFGVEATPLRQDTLPVNGFNREEPMKFTGHERDFSGGTSSENSNYIDYMHARSTVPQWGRFLSVDPEMGDPRRPQSWNRYVYVMNNPVAYTDPTGKIYELYGFVNDADEQKFFQGLSTKTGLTVTNNNGKLDYARDGNGNAIIATDANGNQLGSATARTDLMSGINSTNRYVVQRTDNNPSVDLGVAQGSLIRLDFADMRQINTGNNPSATFDSSMIFMHEGVGHAFLGLHDPLRQMLQSSNPLLQRQTGDTVNWENKIRSELSLPLRLQYRTELNQQGRRYIPFAAGPVWLP